MDTEKARSYLKTFLEVSEIQISIKESAIKRRNSWKRILLCGLKFLSSLAWKYQPVLCLWKLW